MPKDSDPKPYAVIEGATLTKNPRLLRWHEFCEGHYNWLINQADGARIHLYDQHFSCDFAGYDLTLAIFENCTFKNMKIIRCDLTDVIFKDCDMRSCSLILCEIENADFTGSRLA